MTAIRWDNIAAPNFSGVSSMLESAGKSMNAGLAALQVPVNEANALVEKNWQTQDAQARTDALAKIMAFKDPVALQNAKDSGLYEQLVGGGMSAASKAAVLNGLDTYVPLLQNRDIARINHANALVDNEQQTLRQQAHLQLLKGDMAGYQDSVSKMRDPAAFVNAGIAQQRYLDNQRQAQADFELKKPLIEAQVAVLTNKANAPENSTVRGSGGNGGPGLSEEEYAQHNLDKIEAERLKSLMKPFTLENAAKYIKDNVKDPHAAQGILTGLSDLPAKGYLMPDGTYRQPTQEIIQAAIGKANFGPGLFKRGIRALGELGWGAANSYSPDIVDEVNKLMSNKDIQERLMRGDSLAETLATDAVGTQEAAKKAGARPNRPLTQGESPAPVAAQPDSLAMFMNNGRVRDFATGSYRAAAPVDPRTAPAANQVPVVPVQAGPTGLTYTQLMGGTDPKKEMSANPPISTPLISKEDKPSASVGLSLGASGNITGVHPDAVKIPEVAWSEPKMIQKAAPGAIPKGGGERAVVTFVEDGDTAKLLRGDGSQIKCRIDKIDAPETAHAFVGKPGQAYGNEARKTLQDMIDNKEVTLKITRPADKGNRFGCQIEVEGANVDLAMVQAGAAWLYRRYANDPNLVKAEQEARTAKRGLWADPNPINPEAFRRSLENARERR